jgi:predicted nucleic acid-binding protein
MTALLDTNILLRLIQATHPMHALAQGAVAVLRESRMTLRTVPQILFEFWVVATRPIAVNGLGLTTAECQVELANIKALFPVLPDSPALLAQWEALVAAHDCQGKVAHDARLVAAMRTHGITHLLTFNGGDFQRFPGITVLDPATVVRPPEAPPGGPEPSS